MTARRIPLGDRQPAVASEAWLADDVRLIGDAHIGDHASIWYGAVIRADTERISVGAGSNIQDGCVLHADPGFPLTIGESVTVGHRAVLHGCTIEDNTLIGMGAVIMNGARIGYGSVIAAGTVILEGTEIPRESLVAGVPGKVRRATTVDEQAAIRLSAAKYQELHQRYRESEA